MSKLDEAIAKIRSLDDCFDGDLGDSVESILRRHFAEPPTVADEACTNFEAWYAENKKYCLDERNAGAESFAKILLADDGSGEMTPGPCADTLAMVRKLKIQSKQLAVDFIQVLKDLSEDRIKAINESNDEFEKLENDLARLTSAVAAHHAQKADDRCWMDDDVLYTAASLPPCDRRVGDKVAMLANCARFIDRRCDGGGWRSYAELEAALHAHCCHPDWSYITVPTGGMAPALKPDGWERCHETETLGSGDQVWRRRREATCSATS